MTPVTFRETPAENMPGNPAVVLIGLDTALRAQLQRYFTQRHYRVADADTGPEGRQVVRATGAQLIVLTPDLPQESGWVTIAKLRFDHPDAQVVFVVEEHDHRARQYAHFLNARVQLRQDESLAGLTALVARPPATVQH